MRRNKDFWKDTAIYIGICTFVGLVYLIAVEGFSIDQDLLIRFLVLYLLAEKIYRGN